MNGGASEKKPYGLILIIGASVFTMHLFGDKLVEMNLILPAVAIILFAVFGAMFLHFLKEWKKTDEEIVSGFLPFVSYFRGTDQRSFKDKALHFFCAFVVLSVFLHRTKEFDGALGRYFLCAISLLWIGTPMFRELLAKFRGTVEAKPPQMRTEVIIAIIVGLLPTAFMCFFCGIGIYHGVWWFTVPTGLVFLTFFTRPLVAGIRILFAKQEDTGENHIQKGHEFDPWDRPDRER